MAKTTKTPERPPMLLANCCDCDDSLQWLTKVGDLWVHVGVDRDANEFGVRVHPNYPAWIVNVDREQSDPAALAAFDAEPASAKGEQR